MVARGDDKLSPKCGKFYADDGLELLVRRWGGNLRLITIWWYAGRNKPWRIDLNEQI